MNIINNILNLQQSLFYTSLIISVGSGRSTSPKLPDPKGGNTTLWPEVRAAHPPRRIFASREVAMDDVKVPVG